jgi:hypothetical protein
MAALAAALLTHVRRVRSFRYSQPPGSRPTGDWRASEARGQAVVPSGRSLILEMRSQKPKLLLEAEFGDERIRFVDAIERVHDRLAVHTDRALGVVAVDETIRQLRQVAVKNQPNDLALLVEDG